MKCTKNKQHWLKHNWKNKTVLVRDLDMELPCKCHWLKRLHFLMKGLL